MVITGNDYRYVHKWAENYYCDFEREIVEMISKLGAFKRKVERR